jgi:hypothetical protein
MSKLNRPQAETGEAPKPAAKYWLAVASADHVQLGVAGGFAQLGHGKSTGLERMRPGDWFIYYSPTTKMGGGQRLQAFTALGQVLDEPIYKEGALPPPRAATTTATAPAKPASAKASPRRAAAPPSGGDLLPFRRKVRYEPIQAVPLATVAAALHFSRRPAWGMALRRGHLAIDEHDFKVLTQAMNHRPKRQPR